MYALNFSTQAQVDLAFFKRSNKRCYKKIRVLLDELRMHPHTGTGRPERLKYDLSGCWSRRIDDEHRLVYSIDEKVVLVHVFSMRHHYTEK